MNVNRLIIVFELLWLCVTTTSCGVSYSFNGDVPLSDSQRLLLNEEDSVLMSNALTVFRNYSGYLFPKLQGKRIYFIKSPYSFQSKRPNEMNNGVQLTLVDVGGRKARKCYINYTTASFNSFNDIITDKKLYKTLFFIFVDNPFVILEKKYVTITVFKKERLLIRDNVDMWRFWVEYEGDEAQGLYGCNQSLPDYYKVIYLNP